MRLAAAAFLAAGALANGTWGTTRTSRIGVDQADPVQSPAARNEAGAKAWASPSEAQPPPAPPEPPPPDVTLLTRQAAAYEARRPKSPLEVQKFRRATSVRIQGPGGREGTATLIDLNPRINQWYVLELRLGPRADITLHLENPRPDLQRIVLDPSFPSGLVVARAGERRPCELWAGHAPERLGEVARDGSPYTELCGGDVLVRHRTPGSHTAKEWAADFLRTRIWGGEKLTVLARRTLYADAFLEEARVAAEGPAPHAGAGGGPGFPPAALVDPTHRGERLDSRDLCIPFHGDGAMLPGRWYPALDTPGVFVSMTTPGRVAPEVLANDRVRNLDAVERDAVVFLVAFDLEAYELGFCLGTDHPGVGWSERAPRSARDPNLPGPDGFDRLDPLQPTGLVPPGVADRVIATFAGGFKRQHGAFRSGALARVSSASHYGFIEAGTVLSKLQPGLATLLALEDGRVEMKTWTRADDADLEGIRFARQNGVPLLERARGSGAPVPGALIGRWGDGNWSGSQNSKLRTVRAGAGLSESAGRSFLVYAYFSSATPSAMALVFAAYGCSYAMHLDMNALEHTYLAHYRPGAGRLEIDHLVSGMSAVDKASGGTIVPRFLGFADNRDFFYLAHRRAAASPRPATRGAVAPAPAPTP